MKQIIQRALPLNQPYFLVDKKYIPLENGCGCGCDNCGKLIANIATIKNQSGKVYNIGFDCLETILINNSLLSSNDILEYEKAKKMIPKIIKCYKTIKEMIHKTPTITGLRFERQPYESSYFPFYWLQNNNENSRDNDYFKAKDLDLDFLIYNLKNIFPKLSFFLS